MMLPWAPPHPSADRAGAPELIAGVVVGRAGNAELREFDLYRYQSRRRGVSVYARWDRTEGLYEVSVLGGRFGDGLYRYTPSRTEAIAAAGTLARSSHRGPLEELYVRALVKVTELLERARDRTKERAVREFDTEHLKMASLPHARPTRTRAGACSSGSFYEGRCVHCGVLWTSHP